MEFIVNLIIKLLAQFVPFESEELARLLKDAQSWCNGIIAVDSDTDKGREKSLKEYPDVPIRLAVLKYYSNQWYIRLSAGVLYIYFHRKIQKWMNPILEDEGKTTH